MAAAMMKVKKSKQISRASPVKKEGSMFMSV